MESENEISTPSLFQTAGELTHRLQVRGLSDLLLRRRAQFRPAAATIVAAEPQPRRSVPNGPLDQKPGT